MMPIAAPLIPAHWPRIWGLIEPAVLAGGEHTERSVLTGLLHGGFVLWSDCADIAQARACVMTAWCDYPAGRIGFVQFAGGIDADAWLPDAIADFCAWAKSMGCKELRVIGRKGWARKIHRTPTSYVYVESLVGE